MILGISLLSLSLTLEMLCILTLILIYAAYVSYFKIKQVITGFFSTMNLLRLKSILPSPKSQYHDHGSRRGEILTF